MSEGAQLDLLVDLARLLKKHGPDAFEKLASDLSSPQFSEQLVHLLTAGANAARTALQTKAVFPSESESRNLRASLVGLGDSVPEESAILVRLYDDLMAQHALPTLKEIREFARTRGLLLYKARTRTQAVESLVEAIRDRPIEEMREIAAAIQPSGREDDRSLENWTRIILDKDFRAKRVS